MENYLCSLEEIFNQLLKTPKRAARSGSVDRINQYEDKDTVIVPESQLITENIQARKTILELKQKLFNTEQEAENYRLNLETLNKMNRELRSAEKSLREALLQAKGAIRVICRIKPAGLSHTIRFDDRRILVDDKEFVMDRIFEPRSTQEDVFEELRPEVMGVMDGYNVCVFAYGQTGSGKTFTMSGEKGNEGVVSRALKSIGKAAEELAKEGFRVGYTAKYLEVYNESVRDLISGELVTVVHDGNTVRLKDCKELSSESIEEIGIALETAGQRRTTGETRCNQNSSRSHSVFVLGVSMQSGNERREGRLCLIDLAGSERLSESKAENERLKETQFINKSLSALGNVIVALKKRDRHIPYRDSKLTDLMQEYFSGRSRTTMIVNINPESLGETVCSLRFASKVSECSLGGASRNISKYI